MNNNEQESNEHKPEEQQIRIHAQTHTHTHAYTGTPRHHTRLLQQMYAIIALQVPNSNFDRSEWVMLSNLDVPWDLERMMLLTGRLGLIQTRLGIHVHRKTQALQKHRLMLKLATA